MLLFTTFVLYQIFQFLFRFESLYPIHIDAACFIGFIPDFPKLKFHRVVLRQWGRHILLIFAKEFLREVGVEYFVFTAIYTVMAFFPLSVSSPYLPATVMPLPPQMSRYHSILVDASNTFSGNFIFKGQDGIVGYVEPKTAVATNADSFVSLIFTGENTKYSVILHPFKFPVSKVSEWLPDILDSNWSFIKPSLTLTLIVALTGYPSP